MHPALKVQPELDVTPSLPAYEAPIAAHTAAISSSAWNVDTPASSRSARWCRIDDAGVIGYEQNITCVSASSPAASSPSATPSAPVMVRYSARSSGAAGVGCCTSTRDSSAVSPYA